MLPADLPRIIVGTARMGSPLPDGLLSGSDRARAFAFLDGLLAMGCSAFDLAASYQLGGTERLFGAWMASRRHRDQLFLISKGGHPVPVVQPHRLTPRALSADLHASLGRLRVERIDLYLLHRDDETEPLASILETLTSFHRQGKVAAWGVSNWTPARIRSLGALAQASGVASAAASSPHFSLFEWTKTPWNGSVSIAGHAGTEARAYHESTQLPVLAWSPLGGGFLSAHPGGRSGAYSGAANEGRRERAKFLAAKYGRTVAQIALAYLYNHPFPVFPVVAARSVDHVKSNRDAMSVRLSTEEIAWLENGGARLVS